VIIAARRATLLVRAVDGILGTHTHKCPLKRTLIGYDRPLAAHDGRIKPERADDQRERPCGKLLTLPGDAAPPHS
jgi:hypothetical protein